MAVFSDDELYEAYRYSAGLKPFRCRADPASVAASLASAKIHLSEEIYELQRDLADKITYCNELMAQTPLPLIKQNACPVHFIGTAVPAIAYKLGQRLIADGFYINVATFPVVPARNTGIRFSISRHNTREDIRALVAAMDRHYGEVLREEGYTLNQVRSAFKLPPVEETTVVATQEEPLSVQVETSIERVDRAMWNACFGERGAMDWDAMRMYERAFSGNEEAVHNWQFVYLLMRDAQQRIVLANYVYGSDVEG